MPSMPSDIAQFFIGLGFPDAIQFTNIYPQISEAVHSTHSEIVLSIRPGRLVRRSRWCDSDPSAFVRLIYRQPTSNNTVKVPPLKICFDRPRWRNIAYLWFQRVALLCVDERVKREADAHAERLRIQAHLHELETATGAPGWAVETVVHSSHWAGEPLKFSGLRNFIEWSVDPSALKDTAVNRARIGKLVNFLIAERWLIAPN